MKNRIITVQDIPITVSLSDEEDFICITDMAAAKSDNSRAADVIRNWLRNRSTLEFLSTWEEMYNLRFKVFESEHFKKDVGLVTFTPSVSEWVEKTDAIGLFVKIGRYGGTFAHKDIAFEFASAINPVFKLYLIREFQRLKTQENDLKKIERDANPGLAKNSNVRDYASINELTVLSNLESHNAQMIREGKGKAERYEVLKEIAEYQIRILSEAENISKQIKAGEQDGYQATSRGGL
ncbi:MAG: KilA-N domain-containing protein [Lachnospiraceae bacterium]|nr:KilA-N domain-containing protein [Lachnospiraceae bacterium]